MAAGIFYTPIVLIVFSLFVCYGSVESVDCNPCDCTTNTMECRWKNLVDIPSFIPYDTTILRLFRNNIPVLKNDSFLTLQKLEELHLTGNRIRTIAHHAYRGLVSLKILRLEQNEIDGLPPLVFSFLTQLETLDLSYNYITELSPRVFVHLDNLKELNLRGNRIAELGREAFSFMPAIQILQMNENILKHISEGMFRDLASLQEVHLKDNEIKTVATDAFLNSTNVKVIDLSGSNQITYLEGETFRHLTKLEDIRLNGNQFLCECQLYSFREWMNTATTVNWFRDTLAVCALPPERANTDLFSIPLASFICTTTTPTTTTTTVTTTTEQLTTTTEPGTTTTTVQSASTTSNKVVVVPAKTDKSTATTWFLRPPTTATPTILAGASLPIIIGCSCAAFVIIVAIIVVCVCCKKCQKKQSDSGIYKVRENNLAHDQIRSNHVRFENEMNDKNDTKTPNGKLHNGNGSLPNGNLPNGNGSLPKGNGYLPNGKVPNGHVTSNGNGHVSNGVPPQHKKDVLNIDAEYNNKGYTPDIINSVYRPEDIFHTESSLQMAQPYSNNPDYNKNMANLKRDYDNQVDVSFNPGGSSFDDVDSRPSQRSSAGSSPTLNSSSGLLPAWDYPPVDKYEPSICSQSSLSSKKVRTETYV